MNYVDVIILSAIEGLTEFLPVSSTGHLILTSHFLGLEQSEFLKAFEVIIQFGAIMAVVALYYKKFFVFEFNFYKKLILGSSPILILGFIFKNQINALLDSPATVAYSLIFGGVFFIVTDYLISVDLEKKEISLSDSFKIGLLQCFALIPGVSRSGATILAAQALRYPKKLAAEFSFFLAVPTLTAATLYKAWKIKETLTSDQFPLLILGILLSFLFALVAIKTFIKLVSHFGFKWFGVYRIIIGVIVLFNL